MSWIKIAGKSLLWIWGRIKRCWHGFWSWYKGLYRGRRWYVKMLAVIGTMITLFFIYLVMVATNFLWLFGSSPSLSEIMNPKTATASYVYSADGELIGKYYNENRTPVKYEEVNPVFFQTLIDTEDERFYDHMGIDFTGLVAAVKDMVVHGKSRGASTITQQLVKNMFRVRKSSTGLLGNIPGVKLIIMKTKEWILATEVELFYGDKQRILEMYANTVDFGNNAYGIKTAAKVYFDVSPAELTTDQCAVLVGTLKGTTLYNPRRNPDNALKRRNVVLHNLLEHDHITEAEYKAFSAMPLNLRYTPEEDLSGTGAYFRQAVVDELRGWCEDNGYDLYTDGLEIHTTLDTRIQHYAEDAVTEQMRRIQDSFNAHWGSADCWVGDDGRPLPDFLQNVIERSDCYKQLADKYGEKYDSIEYHLNEKRTIHLFDYDGGHDAEMSAIDSIRYMLHFMHCGLVAMDPVSGEVKAWVGDIDYKTWKYDKVTASHQPGSTFKLFVYSAAMECGLRPCDRRMDQFFDTMVQNKRTKQLEHWTPHNADGHFTNMNMTLRQAFAQSVNTIAVRLGLDVGTDRVASTAHAMGINSQLEVTPAISLGSSDVNLLELVNSYSTVVRDGMMMEPVLVTRIYQADADGEKHLIYDSKKDKPAATRAISHRSAYYMLRLLEAGRTDAGGTSMSMNGYIPYDTDFGAKTGTSNSHADAWFIAVSPRLVAGAWVGGEYRQIHFRTGALGQGNRTALPVVGAFLRRVFSDKEFADLHRRFARDEGLDRVAALCTSEPVERDSTNADSLSVDSLNYMELDDPGMLPEQGDGDRQGNDGGNEPALSPERQSVERVRSAFGTSKDPVPERKKPASSQPHVPQPAK